MANRKIPTHLKLLKGSRVNKKKMAKEPKPTGDLFDAPDHLTDDQKQEWAYAIANSPQGMLKRLDRTVLEIFVVAVNLHRQAVIAVNKSGLIVKSSIKGEPMQNPYLAIINKQGMIMLRAVAELGFSPASRSRVVINDPSSYADDSFDDF